MSECEGSYEEKGDADLNPYQSAMLNDLELYSVHTESAEIEKWSAVSTKVDYVGHNRKSLPTNRVKYNPTEG